MTITVENLFNQIAEIYPNPPILDGWCSHDKAITLAAMVLALRPDVSCEIGVYGGRSFFPMAMAHAAIGKGVCVGIDPWSQEIAIREQTTPEDRVFWAGLPNDFMDNLHDKVKLFIRERQLEKFTHIIRKESRNSEVPNIIGLLSVDGSHSDTALHDVVKFAPHVYVGGFCVTDDTNWTGGGVSRAERRLVEMKFRKLYSLGTGAVFQKCG